MVRKEKTINYYEILFKLKHYEYELKEIAESKAYSKLDILQEEIKAYIFANEVLKEYFVFCVKEFYTSLEKEDIKQEISNTYNEIKTIINKNRRLVVKFSEIDDGAILAERGCFSVIDYPNFFYYPSITLNKIAKNEYKCTYNPLITKNISSFYFSILRKIINDVYLNSFAEYAAFAFWVHSERINIDDEIFHFYFLITTIRQALNNLQNYLKEIIYEKYYSISKEQINSWKIENEKIKNCRRSQCKLSDEQIKILRLRKTLENNTYKNIGCHMKPQLSESNITQKFMKIKNILGASSPDEAVAKFEEAYYSLSDSDE